MAWTAHLPLIMFNSKIPNDNLFLQLFFKLTGKIYMYFLLIFKDF